MSKLRNAEVRDITDVDPVGEADSQCLNEIAAVLRKHDALSRFGVFLVHKHFDVAEDEALVERCDPESRTLTIRPVKVAALATTGLIETNWTFMGAKDKPIPQVSCEIYCEKDDKGRHKSYHKKEH